STTKAFTKTPSSRCRNSTKPPKGWRTRDRSVCSASPSTASFSSPPGGLGGGAHAGWLRADGHVFAIGFVPDGNDFDALFGGFDTGAQLGLGLVRETVSHAEQARGLDWDAMSEAQREAFVDDFLHES